MRKVAKKQEQVKVEETTEKIQEKKENKKTQIIATMIRETEKAYLLEFLVAYKKSSTRIQRWFPKSRTSFLGEREVFAAEGSRYSCEVSIFEVEDWILRNLRWEICEYFNGVPRRVKFQTFHPKKNTYTLV